MASKRGKRETGTALICNLAHNLSIIRFSLGLSKLSLSLSHSHSSLPRQFLTVCPSGTCPLFKACMYVCFASRQTLRINKLFPIVATGPTLLPSPSIRRRGLLSQTPATSTASVLVMFFLPAPSPFPLSFPISPVMAYNRTDSPLPRVSQIIGTKLEKKESETKKKTETKEDKSLLHPTPSCAMPLHQRGSGRSIVPARTSTHQSSNMGFRC